MSDDHAPAPGCTVNCNGRHAEGCQRAGYVGRRAFSRRLSWREAEERKRSEADINVLLREKGRLPIETRAYLWLLSWCGLIMLLVGLKGC